MEEIWEAMKTLPREGLSAWRLSFADDMRRLLLLLLSCFLGGGGVPTKMRMWVRRFFSFSRGLRQDDSMGLLLLVAL